MNYVKLYEEFTNESTKLKCFYIHGLGATPSNEITTSLSEYNVIQPKITYTENTDPYFYCMDIIRKNKPNFIVGHSVGGVMAFYLAKEFNIPALLLCPAFGDQYKIFTTKSNKPYTPKIEAIIGNQDDEVNKKDQLERLNLEPNCQIKYIDNDHDIDPELLKQLVNNFLNGK